MGRFGLKLAVEHLECPLCGVRVSGWTIVRGSETRAPGVRLETPAHQ